MVIELNEKQCIDMELHLNKTDIKREFIKLGDKLYFAGIGKDLQEITSEEYYWLQENIKIL